jgi:hypothetical protein
MVSEVITAASATAAVGSVMTAAAAPESILACVDEVVDEAAAAAAVADMLAAMAAAAIAKGAVALPEVGGVTGVSVTATVTGIAVAMAFVAVAASCCEAAGSGGEPAAEVSAEDEVAADFAVSDFELPDFPLEGCGASELALEGGAAPEGGAEAEVFWLPEPLLVDGAAGAVFCDPPLVAAAGASSEGDCQAGGGGVAVGLLALLAALPSTSAPKISFPGVESDLAARGGAL